MRVSSMVRFSRTCDVNEVNDPLRTSGSCIHFCGDTLVLARDEPRDEGQVHRLRTRVLCSRVRGRSFASVFYHRHQTENLELPQLVIFF